MQTWSTLLSILIATLAALAAAYNYQYPLFGSQPYTTPDMSSSSAKSLNVFRKPLAMHSQQPMTGFMRNGYCEVPASDFGNHAVAAEVSEAFLDFTAKNGNDLRPVGLKGGCKWCLCASRWLEAFNARDREGESIVPKVYLNATNVKALDKIDMESLKKYAVDKEQ